MNGQRVNRGLVQAIQAVSERSPGGSLSFRDYMEMCLYHPEYGYYTGDRRKVGKTGDYYTSSSIGGIMGEMVAACLVRLASAFHDRIHFVEWGGGTGRLALQILDTIRLESPGLYRRMDYTLIEKSGYHLTLQREALIGHAGAVRFAEPEAWFESAPRNAVIVFSNELVDAFPVHRIRCRRGNLMELYVSPDESGDVFREIEKPCVNADVLDYVRRENIELSEGQTAEVNLDGYLWMKRVAGWLETGHILTVDYGDTAEEIYAPHRMEGTLMCYREHRAHDNPYVHAGEQDITAHVNFSALIRAAAEAGITEWKLSTQLDFLVAEGILDRLSDHAGVDPFGETARRNRAIRQLLLSDGMSELFKVLLLSKRPE